MKSLKTKLTLIIAALCVVLLIVEGFSTLKKVNPAYEDLLCKNYDSETAYFASVIDGWLGEAMATIDAVDAVASGEVGRNRKEMLEVLMSMTASNDLFSDVYVQPAEGGFLDGTGWEPDADWDGRTRPWYTGAVSKKGDYALSEPFVDAITGGLVVTMSRYYEHGDLAYVAAADILISRLLEDIDKLALETGEQGGYIFVVADSGPMIYHPNADFLSTVDKTRTLADTGIDYAGAAADNSAPAITDYDGKKKYATARSLEDVGWTIYFISPAENYDNIVNDLQMHIWLIILVCLIVALVVAAGAGIMIASPIAKASAQVMQLCEDVKGGRADLTKDIEVSTKDEVGRLVSSVNELKNAMANIISQINGASDELVDNVNSLKSVADMTSQNASSMSATMQEMSATSEETSNSTDQVSRQVGDITALTEQMSKNTLEKTDEISESLKKIDKLKAEIDTKDKDMLDRLNDAIQRLGERISDTQKVGEIRTMTESISEIASQTNLLSLNASIEAARAGESGRGFAVVADEIGKLATNSADMAGNIQKVSDEVLAIVDQLVSTAQEVSDIMIRISEENSEEKRQLIEEYISSLRECYDAMSAISDSNSEITSSISNINTSISSIDSAVDENAQGVSSIAQGAGELVNASADVLTGAESIHRISSDLKEQVRGFRC